MSFGYGIHFCLGAALARMEGRTSSCPRPGSRRGRPTGRRAAPATAPSTSAPSRRPSTHRYERTDHRLGDLHLVVAGDGRTALGNLDCEAHHVTGDVDRVLTIRYEDAYRRDPEGRWRFVTRDVRVQSIDERPATVTRPGAPPPAVP